MHKFKLVVGDYSQDGHNKTEKFIVECSEPFEEFEESLEKLNKKFKDNPISLTEEYEAKTITSSQLKTLNIDPESIFDTHSLDEAEEIFDIYTADDYIKLFIQYVTKNTSIRLKVIDCELPTLSIGGYGIYE